MYEDGDMMTAAELRFEADLDAQSAEERYEESWYEQDECPNCGEDCEGSCEDDEEDESDWLIRHGVGGEDAFIDASED